MKPVEFEGQARVLEPPRGVVRGACGGLPMRHDSIDGFNVLLSYWRPSAEDLAVLNAGGHVELCVSGRQHPMVRMDAVAGVIELP